MRFGSLPLVVVLLASWAGPVHAQNNFTSNLPFGHNPALAQNEPTPGSLDSDSGVAFLDSAIPHTMIRTRFDLVYGIRQPNRAEYFWAKGGPYNPGPLFPEKRLDFQELRTYGEYALNPWFSLFLETPYKFINPQVNANNRGTGDLDFGLKFAMLATDTWTATVQLRMVAPTASARGLGNEHFTFEPGILGYYRITDQLHLEGEFQYWAPLDGTDFAGDLLKYGIGLTWGSRTYGEMWLMAVAECQGYTILGGKSTSPNLPYYLNTVDADGTILNGALGIRMGYSKTIDWYVGYNRPFTGSAWHHDQVRFELRFQF